MTPARLRPDERRHRGEGREGHDVYGLRASGRILKFARLARGLRQGRVREQGRSARRRGRRRRREDSATRTTPRRATSWRRTPRPSCRSSPRAGAAPRDAAGRRHRAEVHAAAAAVHRGSLVRELEERGIGRPSTYAEIISKVQARDYVEKMDGTRFRPTHARQVRRRRARAERARLHGPGVHVEDGRGARRGRGRQGGARRLAEALLQALPRAARHEQEGQALEPRARADRREVRARRRRRCSSAGRRTAGSSAARTTPSARTRATSAPTASRRSRARPGSTATSAASRWSSGAAASASSSRAPATPSARTRKPVPLGVKCPKCGGDLIEIRSKKRGGKTFYGCSNYANETIKCDFKLWQKPIAEPCPNCGAPFLVHGRHARQADDRLREQGVRLQARRWASPLRGRRRAWPAAKASSRRARRFKGRARSTR